jgi:hypothetical protein
MERPAMTMENCGEFAGIGLMRSFFSIRDGYLGQRA